MKFIVMDRIVEAKDITVIFFINYKCIFNTFYIDILLILYLNIIKILFTN